MPWFIILSLALLPTTLFAETLVASRTVRPHEILTSGDLAIIDKTIPGALQSVEEALGLESRVVLYAGRPIRAQDLGPPAIVERNQIVTLIYSHGTLTIAAEARALTRGGEGDLIRVINIASRTTVSGVVRADGTVLVGAQIRAN